MNRPLISLRPPRADQITEEVEMEAQKSQHRCDTAATRSEKDTNRDKETEPEIMGKQMMILPPPFQGMSGIPGQEISDDSETVNIRDHAGNGDEDSFSPIRAGCIRNRPTEK